MSPHFMRFTRGLWRVFSLQRRLAMTTIAASLLAPTQSSPQTPDFSEPLEVRLVEVEVFVTDKANRPILDLSEDDFTLLVDNVDQPISFFSAPIGSAGIDVSDPSPPDGHLVIFVDNSNIEVIQRNSIIAEIQRYLATSSHSEYSTLIASSSSSEFEIRQDFTNDTALLRAALDEISQTTANDQRVKEYQTIFREVQRLSSAVQDFSGKGIAPQARGLMGQIQAYSDNARNDAERSGGYLWRLTDSLAGLPGRRGILYVGGVLSLNPGATLYAALRDVLGRRTGAEAQETGARLPAGIATDGAQSLQALATHASVYGVSLYAITEPGRSGALSGGVTTGSMEAAPGDAPGAEDTWSPGVAFRSRNEARESVEILAEATGGLADSGANRVESTVSRITDDLRSFYLLTFQPTHESDGQLHRIAVSVDRKKTNVRHRNHYRSLTWDQETAAVVRSTMHFGGEVNPLGVQIEIGETPSNDPSTQRLPISIQIPLSNLAVVSSGPSHLGQVTLFYTVGNDLLAANPMRKIVLPITIPNEQLLDAMGQLTEYKIEIDLSPGLDRLVLGIRDDLEDRLSTISLHLEGG